mmetsp:Transcript_12242/g.56705  ORF Transcript_12242/g.56705 Transcript_12242/m.56705 type:complete len:208 (+) Transcript_12242:46-669(+)
MPAAPTLPPADATARDAFSGGADILRASGLKGPYVHFSRAGPPDAALDVDSYAPGTSASGFELRQGRAMELAPLLEATPPQRPTELTPVPRDAARTAFGFRPTPYALPDGDKGAIPAALAERRRVDAARAAEAAAAAAAAANAAASGGDADAAAAGAGDDGKGEKRKRDKKEKKERKEKKRRRRDGGPEASGLSGPTEISGETTRMS